MGATPDIGTTIGDGYRRGFERLATVAPSALVPAVVVGAIAGIVAQAQTELVPNAGEIVANVLAGKDPGLGRGDLAMMQLLSAVDLVVQLLVGMAGVALFGGLLHKARHAGTMDQADGVEVPAPAAVMGAIATMIGRLMPKLGIIILLTVAGTLVSIIHSALGAIVTFVTLVALVYFSVRWAYAAIVAGSGEATNDAAFARSEQAVDGRFWPTFGIMLVVAIAIFIPVSIIGGIVGAILPGTFLSAFGSSTVYVFGMVTLYATALESAWAQVEAKLDGDVDVVPGAMPTATGMGEQALTHEADFELDDDAPAGDDGAPRS